MRQIFPGVFKKGNEIYTKNLVPGFSVYGEKRIKVGGEEYRFWDPRRSKPAAAILKGLKNFPIKPRSKILYLGIGDGTTASHFSDIIGWKGVIFGVDIAEKVFEKLLLVCEKRKNIIPYLGDANKPQQYIEFLEEIEPEILYQDVAQPNQAEIAVKNAEYVSKWVIVALKARSIDVTKKPKEVYWREMQILDKIGEVVENISLDPYEKDHAFVVIKL